MNHRLRSGMVFFLFCICAALFSSPVIQQPENRSVREIDFSGFTWRVKSSTGPVAPGPNIFRGTEDAVYVSERGLHLTIGKQQDHWYATEIFTKQRVGYGTYTFTVETDALKYDPSVVAGFFTWDSEPVEFNREIDIEFASWGSRDGIRFQYVVQPYSIPERITVFDPNLQGSITTHRIIWLADSIEFMSYHGAVDLDDPDADTMLMNQWKFIGDVPSEGKTRFRINLWLFQGKEPTKPTEMIIKSFTFDPLR